MKYFKIILKRCGFFVFAALAISISSCSSLDLNERLDGPIATLTKKNVLIEDFTGQKCINCPLAHEEVDKLQKIYGKHKVIAVAMHGGPQAIDVAQSTEDGTIIGLANEESKEYNRRHGSFSYPKGEIDKSGQLLDFEKWNAFTMERLSLKPKVDLQWRYLEIKKEGKDNFLSLEVECSALEASRLEGCLQLWLTESNIVAIQAMEQSSGYGYVGDYVHNHVFRAAVNGIDGEKLELEKSKKVVREYSFKLNEDWNFKNMSAVMFFYNASEGVMQVIDTPIIDYKTN